MMPETPTNNQLAERVIALLSNDATDLYTRLNQLRDWFNSQTDSYDLYLEDVWNDNADGETHFEYILRSLITKDETVALAADIYVNHKDANGVWHLGDYQHSHINGDGTPAWVATTMTNFLTADAKHH